MGCCRIFISKDERHNHLLSSDIKIHNWRKYGMVANNNAYTFRNSLISAKKLVIYAY